MTCEVIAVLMNLASHDGFRYDRSVADEEDTLGLDTLLKIQDSCRNVIKDPEMLQRYFFDYGDTRNCLAAVLCGKDSSSLSLRDIEKRYSSLKLKDRLSFLQAEDDQDLLVRFMEFLDATELNDSEKYFQIHALMDPEAHKENVFEILREAEEALRKHEDEIHHLYLQQKKKLKKMDIRQWIQEHSTVQLLDEAMEDVQITLFDPFTLKVSSGNCLIGAYLYLDENNGSDTLKETVLTYAKIFSDESKLNILKLLSGRNMINREIAEETGLTAATISHHMSVLTESRLVKATVSSKKTIYELNKRKLDEILKEFDLYFQGK